MKCEYCGEYMIDDMERAQGFCWNCAEDIAQQQEAFERTMELEDQFENYMKGEK